MTEIVRIEADSEWLADVVTLAEKNRKTLGFFPRGAFEEKARKNRILVAVEQNRVCGYLLFDYNMRKQLAYIVHLCVDERQRQQGIARKLFQELESTVEGQVGCIRVHCRTDYEASKIWPQLGFHKLGEKPGRSAIGSMLGVWQKDVCSPNLDLFRSKDESVRRNIRAAIDINVLADSMKPESDSTAGAHAVMQDWLSEVVDLLITPELSSEIDRDPDKQRGSETLNRARSLDKISCPLKSFEDSKGRISDQFSKSRQDQSDLRHLSWCGCDNVDFFVTSDENLCKKSQVMSDRIGVRIVHPDELVHHTDIVLHSADYQPRRFGETEIRIRRPKDSDRERLISVFAPIAPEGQRQFRRELSKYLLQPRSVTTQLISYGESILALVSWELHDRKKIVVHLLRLAQDDSSDVTTAVGIINWLMKQCFAAAVQCLEIGDRNVPSAVRRECYRHGFHQSGQNLIRWIRHGQHELPQIRRILEDISLQSVLSSEYCAELRRKLERVDGTHDLTLLLQLEREIWPLKIKELQLPTYIVPIRSEYALHLFDQGISSQDLFGGDSRTLLNAENAYYRSSKGRRIEAPARVLWYVSRGSGRYPEESMAIRASSYLDEVHIGQPDTLYNRFRHLGIYRWKDVLETARGNRSQELMAFVFSLCEEFTHPIRRTELGGIWQTELNRKFNVMQPLRIPDNIFWRIYNSGVGLLEGQRNDK